MKSPKARSIGAEELDKRFDRGEDVSDFLDVSRARKNKRHAKILAGPTSGGGWSTNLGCSCIGASIVSCCVFCLMDEYLN